MHRTIAILLLCLSSLFAFGQDELAAVWSRTFPELSPKTYPIPSAIALATNGKCAAIAGAGKVEVLDSTGKVLWTWEYGRVNKFITAGALALSPSCDEVALAGDSGYKYTWIADRHGLKVPIQTTSTPLSLTFSHNNELVALGTGGCDLLLITKSGEVKWKKGFSNGFCVLGKLSFSADDKFILLQGSSTGVVGIDGNVIWMTSDSGMSAARDLRTFVSWWVPNHGPSWGRITALDGKGKELWRRTAPGISGAISASGDTIAAPVYANQNMTQEQWNALDEQDVEVQVFSRSGGVLKSMLVERAELLAMSPDGNGLLLRLESAIKELDLNGNTLATIPDRQLSYSTVLVPEDFAGALILSRNPELQLRWYKLK